MENDRETTLKIVVREDFSEEAIFAWETEWVWELVIWIQGQYSNRRTNEATAGVFLAYLRVSMEAGWLESSGIRRQE